MAYAAMMGLGALPTCMTPAMSEQLHKDWAAYQCERAAGQTAYPTYYRCWAREYADALVKRFGVPACAEYTVPKGSPCERITDVQYATCLRDKRAHGETLTAAESAFLSAHTLNAATICSRLAAERKLPQITRPDLTAGQIQYLQMQTCVARAAALIKAGKTPEQTDAILRAGKTPPKGFTWKLPSEEAALSGKTIAIVALVAIGGGALLLRRRRRSR